MLTADEYDRLKAEAAASERDPYQHARWLVLRGLAPLPTSPSETPEERAS